MVWGFFPWTSQIVKMGEVDNLICVTENISIKKTGLSVDEFGFDETSQRPKLYFCIFDFKAKNK